MQRLSMLVAVLLLASCASSRAKQQPQAQGKVATGYVFHDRNKNGLRDVGEPGVEDALVSNGRRVRRCAVDGRYEISIGDDTILFVIKPSGWATPTDSNQLAAFHYLHKPKGSPKARFPGVTPTGPLPASVDFALYPQEEKKRFNVVLFGDTQPYSKTEVDYLAKDVIPELVGVEAAFGITLGDIVGDDLSLFEHVNEVIGCIGVPWYYVYGNHDLNYDATSDELADESFERVYGPTNYAFRYGDAHFVVLDNVVWFPKDGEKRAHYKGGFDDRATDFLESYLAHVPQDELVVVCFHIHLDDVNIDRQALFRVLEKHRHVVTVSAHTHVHRTLFFGKDQGHPGNEEHVHLNMVTTCGSWYKGKRGELGIPITRMRDGAPRGYGVLTVDGNQWSLRFKAARRPADYQMDIHLPARITKPELAQTELVVNVFNGSKKSKVWVRYDEAGDWHPLAHVSRTDPGFVALKSEEARHREYWQRALDKAIALASTEKKSYADLKGPLEKIWREQQTKLPWRPLPDPVESTHIWSSKLPLTLAQGPHLVRVRTLDMYGETWESCAVLRVVK